MNKHQKFRPFYYFLDTVAHELQLTDADILYHYTSPEGLKSIVETNKIWFSEIHYLNDKSEIIYTYNLLSKILEKTKDIVPEFKKSLETYIQSHIYSRPFKIDRKPSQNIFVASFSHASDELSLWNYYTKSDKKYGYNIGFKTNFFIEKFSGPNAFRHGYCGKVIYNKRIQEEKIRDALFKYQNNFIDTKDYDEQMYLIDLFMDFIEILSLFFKHKAFESEKEYRLIITQSERESKFSVKYRTQNGIFIPYIEMDFTTDIIKKITASPLVDTSLCDGVEQFLKDHGIRHRVIASKIPIRY